jgi:hypothetical protein
MRFVGKITTYPDATDAERRDNLWFNCDDYDHKLSTTGKFKIYAHYSSIAYRDAASFTNLWTGWVVSKPVEIEISK